MIVKCCHVQLSEEQARSELLSSTQRLRANIDPNKHHIGDQLAGNIVANFANIIVQSIVHIFSILCAEFA